MAGSDSPRSTSHPNQGKTRDCSSQPPKKKKKNHSKKPSDPSKSNQSVQSSLQSVDKSNFKTNSEVKDNSREPGLYSSNRVTEKNSSPVKKAERKANMENANSLANISLEAKNSKPDEIKVNSDATEVSGNKSRVRGRGRGRGTPTIGVAGFAGRGGAPVGTPERPVGGLQERAVEPVVCSVTSPAENEQFAADEERERIEIAHTTSRTEISVQNQKTAADPNMRFTRTTSKTEISIKNQKPVAGQTTLKYKETVDRSTVEFQHSTSNAEEEVQNEKEPINAPKAKSSREAEHARQGGARPKSSQQMSPGSGNSKAPSSEFPKTKPNRLQGQNQQRWQDQQHWRDSRQSSEGSYSYEHHWKSKTSYNKEDGSQQNHSFNQQGRGRGQWGRGRGGQYGRGGGGPRMEVALRPSEKLPSFIQEVKDDLFNCDNVCSLAHCVSSDFRMGQGVAVEFKKRFHGVEELLSQGKGPGQVAFLKREERYVYYLVTKKEYKNKPTILSLEKSLIDLRKLVDEHKVTNLAMPRIGSGLDRLDWNVVLDSIIKIFQEGNVQITVFVHNPKVN